MGRRLRDGCGTLLGCLLIAAAAVVVIVRSVTVWISGHPEIVIGLIALMALGGWSGPRVAQRLGRPGGATDPAGLDPTGFEEYVAALCERDGCRDVQRVGGAGDLGADILAVTPTGRRMLVQCKRYAPSRRVGSPEVQRVGGTYAVVHGADLAVVVTTAAYTEAAVEYARMAGIRLVDGAELAEWAAEKALPPWGADRTG
jgi:restriction system protein